MTTSVALKKDCNRGPRESHPNKLVWEQINSWVWVSQCGRFKIERFVTGDHEVIGTNIIWPNRYRALKHTPYWYGEIAGNESSLAAAKRVCEGLT